MVSIYILARLEIFKDFTDQEIQKVIYCSTEEFFPEDTVILEESKHSKDLYVIVEGRVAVEMKIPTSVDQQKVERISVINAEHIFGELAFIEGTPRSAQIRTIEKVKLLVINEKKAHELFAQDPALGFKMMRNLSIIVCDRLRNINFMWRNILSDIS
jgi:CRP/FNR family transcriptional regulator, cyclic AMP receptor protein